MKTKIRTPYFEIGTKNYVWGDKLLEYAIAADRAAEKYDIPLEAIQGGAETTYPEYQKTIERLRAAARARKDADARPKK